MLASCMHHISKVTKLRPQLLHHCFTGTFCLPECQLENWFSQVTHSSTVVETNQHNVKDSLKQLHPWTCGVMMEMQFERQYRSLT